MTSFVAATRPVNQLQAVNLLCVNMIDWRKYLLRTVHSFSLSLLYFVLFCSTHVYEIISVSEKKMKTVPIAKIIDNVKKMAKVGYFL